MHDHQKEYAITTMCRVLQVLVSGYDAWSKRLPSQQTREDAQIATASSTRLSGSSSGVWQPRLHAEVQAHGRRCGRKRMARLMRELQRSAQLPRQRTITTKSEKGVEVAENVLQRDFHADDPNRKWVSDTTYIWTAEGWLYLAGVLDLFSRMVVGWSMAALQEATLVGQALHMALARRRPQVGVLHHSDRGSTYSSGSYQAMLQHEAVQVSMSGTGNCYDNAAMESFFP